MVARLPAAGRLRLQRRRLQAAGLLSLLQLTGAAPALLLLVLPLLLGAGQARLLQRMAGEAPWRLGRQRHQGASHHLRLLLQLAWEPLQLAWAPWVQDARRWLLGAQPGRSAGREGLW